MSSPRRVAAARFLLTLRFICAFGALQHCLRSRFLMADQKGLRFIGFAFSAVTAMVAAVAAMSVVMNINMH